MNDVTANTTLGEVEKILKQRRDRIGELEREADEFEASIVEWFNPRDDDSAHALDFLVFAHTVEHANEIMRGDRREAEAMDDSYEESHTWRARRAPLEDR